MDCKDRFNAPIRVIYAQGAYRLQTIGLEHLLQVELERLGAALPQIMQNVQFYLTHRAAV